MHLSGLPESINCPDEELELAISLRYNLDDEACNYTWAGPGTTVIKRDDDLNLCRGYCFLSFFTTQGAALAVNQINNGGSGTEMKTTTMPVGNYNLPRSVRLCAEISQPKKRNKNKSKKTNKSTSEYNDKSGNHISELRLRRRRAAPTRKHPVNVRKNCAGSSKPASK